MDIPESVYPDFQVTAAGIRSLLQDLDALLKRQQFAWRDIVRGSIHLNHIRAKQEFLRQIKEFDDIEYPFNFTFDPIGRMKRGFELEVDAIRLNKKNL